MTSTIPIPWSHTTNQIIPILFYTHPKLSYKLPIHQILERWYRLIVSPLSRWVFSLPILSVSWLGNWTMCFRLLSIMRMSARWKNVGYKARLGLCPMDPMDGVRLLLMGVCYCTISTNPMLTITWYYLWDWDTYPRVSVWWPNSTATTPKSNTTTPRPAPCPK